jgi:hypothetical protein
MASAEARSAKKLAPKKSFIRTSKLSTLIHETEIVSFGVSKFLTVDRCFNLFERNHALALQRAFLLWSQNLFLHGPTDGDQHHHRHARRQSALAHEHRGRHISALALIVRITMRRRLLRIFRAWSILKNLKKIDEGQQAGAALLSQLSRMKTENERLRNRLNTLMAISGGESTTIVLSTDEPAGVEDESTRDQQPSEAMRKRLAKFFLRTVLKSNVAAKVKLYFEKWAVFVRSSVYISGIKHERIKVQIGLQHVQSERGKIEEIKGMNDRLRNWLLCTLFFLKWKVKAMEAQVKNEKALRFQEREAVVKQIESLKRRVISAKQLEQDAVATAIARGSEIVDALYTVKADIDTVATIAHLK